MISDNLNFVKSRIESVKHDQEVELIAVSKTRSISEIQEAIDAGQFHFGENYLQESLEKIASLKDNNLTWHFIGPIQANKTAGIAENFDWVHSVDRPINTVDPIEILGNTCSFICLNWTNKMPS